MPRINYYKCSACQRELHRGWGGYQYVEDEEGERVVCGHPGEKSTIFKVLGVGSIPWLIKKSRWWMSKAEKETIEKKKSIVKLVAKRTGYNSECVCKDCLQMFYLDIGDEEQSSRSLRWHYKATRNQDVRLCPHCNSENVVTVMELINQTCPFCWRGKIEEVWTGAVC